MPDNFENSFIRELKLLVAQAVRLGLLRNQVTLGNLKFLALGISREAKCLKTILQCRRNRVQHVRGRDKDPGTYSSVRDREPRAKPRSGPRENPFRVYRLHRAAAPD